MASLLMESHFVVFASELFVNLSLLSRPRLNSMVDTLLLKNTFRSSRYNKFHARINMMNKLEKKEAEENRRASLISKLESSLEDTSQDSSLEDASQEKFKRKLKVRSDKGRRRKRVETLSKPKQLHQCEVCPYKAEKKVRLKRHKRIHSSEKPYKCDLCDATFKVSHVRFAHIKRFHTKEKTHICSDCGKSFFSSGELKRHSFNHLEVKP